MASGRVTLHIKVMLTGESFTVSRNPPALRRSVSPQLARTQMSKHQNNKIKSMINTNLPSYVSRNKRGNQGDQPSSRTNTMESKNLRTIALSPF